MRSSRYVAYTAVLAVMAAMAPGCWSNNQESIRSGRISISSSPENGAIVTMGGRVIGETPLALNALPYGRHLIIIEREGYRRATRIIEVDDSSDQAISIALEPLVGYITIETNPTTARVYLNETQFMGETPLFRAAVPVGQHSYKIQLDKYKALTHEVIVEPDFRYSYAHNLVPEEASLNIFSRPTNANILLNDEPRVESTPARIELTPGTYNIKVASRGYITSEEIIDLGPNEEKTIEFVMEQGHVPQGMLLIPAGKFIMGLDGASPDERPQRELYLDAFYIDRYEVTNEQFKRVFHHHSFPPEAAQHPVTNVTWRQATDYAQAVGKRLPTEAEWEKAARGPDGREYPWGMEFNKDYCNVANPATGTMPVGSFPRGASPYNVMDMAGNAYEWTSSWYQAYPGNTDVKRDYGQTFRVLRGGSYLSDRFGARCARRHFDRIDASRRDYGFRCAKDVAP